MRKDIPARIEKALQGKKCPSRDAVIAKLNHKPPEIAADPEQEAFIRSWGLDPEEWKIEKVKKTHTMVRNIVTGERMGIPDVYRDV